MPDQKGELGERRAQASSVNNFQGRYVMLNPWEGEVACENPQRGTWGGPPSGPTPRPFAAGNTALEGTTTKTLTGQLPALIRTDIPELDLEAGTVDLAPKSAPGSGDGEGGPSGVLPPDSQRCRGPAWRLFAFALQSAAWCAIG